jgi:cell division protein FtsQ
MKKICPVLLAALSAAYLLAAVFFFTGSREKDRNQTCKHVEIVIADSLEKHFLKEKDVVSCLKKTNLYPLNKKRSEINTNDIEQALQKNELIEKAEVVRSLSGNIRMVISQKMPVLRVFVSGGGSYYVDKTGRTMASAPGQAIYVPVASGNIEKSFATGDLYKFALFLQQNDFWDNQIEQIYIRSEQEIEIVPRVGNHRILLGSLDNYENKLKHLRLFYEQVIPRTGWEKYRVINLKYRNQIVCTKK